MKTNGGRLLAAVFVGFVVVILIRGMTGCASGDSAESGTPAEEPVQEVAAVPVEEPDQLPEGIEDLGNTVCPVMGNPVMEGQYIDWEGYRVHLCCAGCDQQFLADPERYLEVLSEDPGVEEILRTTTPVDCTIGEASCETGDACSQSTPACPCCS